MNAFMNFDQHYTLPMSIGISKKWGKKLSRKWLAEHSFTDWLEPTTKQQQQIDYEQKNDAEYSSLYSV